MPLLQVLGTVKNSLLVVIGIIFLGEVRTSDAERLVRAVRVVRTEAVTDTGRCGGTCKGLMVPKSGWE